MAFKFIHEYTPEELDEGVNQAIAHCNDHKIDFYKILKGVDCYTERRKRKLEGSNAATDKAVSHRTG